MTKSEREIREYRSLFTDRRYAENAWRQFIGSSLQGDAAPLPTFVDKNGEISAQSQLDQRAFNNVAARLKKDGYDRPPMQAEVMIEAAVLRGRMDTTTLNLLLERTAGKVRDEIQLSGSQYEDLSDEELEMLAEKRAEQKKLDNKGEEDDNTERATD